MCDKMETPTLLNVPLDGDYNFGKKEGFGKYSWSDGGTSGVTLTFMCANLPILLALNALALEAELANEVTCDKSDFRMPVATAMEASQLRSRPTEESAMWPLRRLAW